MSTSPERVVRVLKAPRTPAVPTLRFPLVEALPRPRLAGLGSAADLADGADAALDPEEVRRDAARRGFAEGYEAGRAEGRDAGRADVRADAAALLGRLDAALGQLAARDRARADELADAASAFAYEVVEVLVGRELAVADTPGRDAVRRALQIATGRGPARVRLHPTDVAELGDPRELADLAGGRPLEVVADPTVERAGCVLETGDTTVDAQLGHALARLREVLAP